MKPPPLNRALVIVRLRQAWRTTLLRYETDRMIGRENEALRIVANRFVALLNDKSTAGQDVVADVGLRVTLAATIVAELEGFERRQ